MLEYAYHLPDVSANISYHMVLLSRTFSVVENFAIVVFEHLQVGNAGISDIASHVEIRATLVGDDLEECGTSRSRSAEHENHLTWPQDPEFLERKLEQKETAST